MTHDCVGIYYFAHTNFDIFFARSIMMYLHLSVFIDSSISFSNKQSATSITLTITCIGNVLRHLLLQPTHSIDRILVSYYYRHHHHHYSVFFHIISVLFFLFFSFSLIISIHSSSLIHHLSFSLPLSSSLLFFFIPLYIFIYQKYPNPLSLSSSYVFFFFFVKTTVLTIPARHNFQQHFPYITISKTIESLSCSIIFISYIIGFDNLG